MPGIPCLNATCSAAYIIIARSGWLSRVVNHDSAALRLDAGRKRLHVEATTGSEDTDEGTQRELRKLRAVIEKTRQQADRETLRLQRTLKKFEDIAEQELARLQQELRIKTAECRSRMHDVRVSTARLPCLDRCNFFMRALSLSYPSPPTSANPILLVNLITRSSDPLLPLCS